MKNIKTKYSNKGTAILIASIGSWTTFAPLTENITTIVKSKAQVVIPFFSITFGIFAYRQN